MTTTTLGHYNVLYKNNQRTVREDLELLHDRHRITLLDLNEARRGTDQGKAIEDFCKDHGWDFRWGNGDVSLAWSRDHWQADEFGGQQKIAKGALELGYTFTHNPARHLVWQGLTFRDGSRHLVYGGHHTAGYYKPASAWPPKVYAYKQYAGKACVLNTNRIQANHFARHPEYQFHHFLIDMNCPQGRFGQWWLPTQVMQGLWVPDTRRGAIDWMTHSHAAAANGLKVRKRWVDRKGLDSDHAAHLKRVSW